MDSAPRVLLIEDHVILREALGLALAASGFDVRAAEDLDYNGVLAAARSFDPQLVLLDFYLADGDSLEMIEPLVAAGSRVLMLTGAAGRPVMGECIEAGAAGILEKGQPLERLVDTIRRALTGSNVMRPTERDLLLERSHAAKEEARHLEEPFMQLTVKERHVLAYLVEGRSAEEIARQELVTLHTVRSQIKSVLAKLGVQSQLAAVAMAHRCGWRE